VNTTTGNSSAMAGAPQGGSRLYGRLWRWHFFAALIVIPFVLWQSITGTLYLWSEWWVDSAHPELRFVAARLHPLPLSDQIRSAFRSVATGSQGSLLQLPGVPMPQSHATHHGTVMGSSGLAVQRILVSEDPARSTAVLLQGANGLPFPVFVNPYTGTVLGQLSAIAWLPGITRALHGGWPLGEPGSWLLELGDGWAIVMIATGLYLWWPRGRGVRALWPRFRAGSRVLLRDLHACVAVWFAIVFLFFLISALPWTAFWGGKLLAAIESNTGQSSPVGFSPGGASVSKLTEALQPLEQAVSAARAGGVRGTLDVRLAPWAGAPLYITNMHVFPSQDRTIIADAKGGSIRGDYTNEALPAIPRFVALGIHVHQADFGAANVWLNTAFAVSLIWLSVTGVLSWWTRKPAQKLGAPPKASTRIPYFVLVSALVVCIVLPLLGASVLLIVLIDAITRRLQPAVQGVGRGK
jgi:uncharacterized iron-regulated membrane protein